MARHQLIGKPAPSISLPDSNGETYTLTPGANGVPIALFFYPKSGSYGCTKEACQFRDNLVGKEVYKRSNIQVVGISRDPVNQQKTFVEKEKLTYPVLSDEKGEARKAYHVGKGMLGLVDARVTFIIDGKGNVRDVLDATLNYGSHSKFVTKWLDKFEEEDKKAAETPAPATDAAVSEAPATESAAESPAEPTGDQKELGKAAQAMEA